MVNLDVRAREIVAVGGVSNNCLTRERVVPHLWQIL
jgi:ABC-type uncharacterized transport system ATPase subunit